MRYSRQREQILRYLRSDYSHPTANEVYNAVSETDPEISLATVYRDLKQLTDSGDILKITSAGEKDRYDGHTALHYHFRCRKCGCVYDIPAADTDMIRELLEKLGADDMVAEGICACCREEA